MSGSRTEDRKGGGGVEGAVDLFAALGFDGVDIACNELSGITTETSRSRRREMAAYARERGLVISNLACYAGQAAGFTALDPGVRAETFRQVRDHLRLAGDLGCARVRVFPGRDSGPGIAGRDQGAAWALEAYQRLSAVAQEVNVTLLVENHPSTLTVTVRETLDLVKAVDRANVRILYDPSNLVVYAGDPDVEGNLRLQQPHLAYVHVKDQVLLSDGRHTDTVPGRGMIPWAKILRLLRAAGCEGFLALEYQRGKRSSEWLPDPDVGMREGLAFLKASLHSARD
jgi:sugar phosphate isomerase/epimerase